MTLAGQIRGYETGTDGIAFGGQNNQQQGTNNTFGAPSTSFGQPAQQQQQQQGGGIFGSAAPARPAFGATGGSTFTGGFGAATQNNTGAFSFYIAHRMPLMALGWGASVWDMQSEHAQRPLRGLGKEAHAKMRTKISQATHSARAPVNPPLAATRHSVSLLPLLEVPMLSATLAPLAAATTPPQAQRPRAAAYSAATRAPSVAPAPSLAVLAPATLLAA